MSMMSETEEQKKVFCDPVHGHIVLDSILVKIIDTPQFQRLRNIKQLGGKYFVYPGASHNRFEHSLGVAYLAGKLVEKIKAKQSDLGIDARDILCVKIAGLCHDLGHGPFSHVWDDCVLREIRKKYPDRKLKDWKHEKGSVDMLDHLLKENGIELEKLKVYNDLKGEVKKKAIEQDINFIKELIFGPLTESGSQATTESHAVQTATDSWSYKGREEDKSFLYEIISNKTNGIDVDRWDYFKRDCHHLGITCIFDINRAMEFVRVIRTDDNGKKHICYRDKEGRNLYQMFQTRELLHRMAYQHKTARAVQRMLTEALVLADDTKIRIPGKVENGKAIARRLSECHLDPVAFTNLTDHIFQLILTSTETGSMQEAKNLLDRIQKRDLYKQIGSELPAPLPNHTAEKIAQEIAAFSPPKTDDQGLTSDDLYVDHVTFHFGMKKEDPFKSIWFFKKDDSDKAFKIPLQKISTFLPEHFQEKVIRVYCKTSSKVKEAERCFDLWKKKQEDTGKGEGESHR